MPSSSRHIDDLGAAPRLVPPMNNNKITKQKGKKDNLLEKKKRKNKVNSVSKNTQYQYKNSDELSKKNILLQGGEKNKLKNKNLAVKINNNNDNKQKRLNNSAQHRQNKFKNINKNDNNNTNNNTNNKLKAKKINHKNTNSNNTNNSAVNITNNNNLKRRQGNDTSKNINKEDSINLGRTTIDDNMVLSKDEIAIIGPKEKRSEKTGKIKELLDKDNTNKGEFNNNTEKISSEIKITEAEPKSIETKNPENKNSKKINSNMNKTPIKSSKKSITKDIKDSTFSAYQDISTKFKKKYEYNNKIKTLNNQNGKNVEKRPKNKNINNELKTKKENNFNSSSINNLNNSSININNNTINNMNNSSINNLNRDKDEGYLGHSCIDINPAEYLKTPISAKGKINGDNNNSRSSYKNITHKKNMLDETNKNKGFTTNITSSDKFNVKNYNNKTIYNKNKTNNKNTHYISKSIHTTYNSKFNDMEKIEESAILFSSNKKKDYSLSRKKNNITSIHGLHNDHYYNIKTKYRLYERNKMSYKNANVTSPINKLSVSLNNNISHSNKYNRYNRYKYGISSSMPKINKHTEYDPNNTIYEFNFKKKNRIRLDFNPNKQYEFTSNDIQDKKKKNKLNNSVTIGKTDEKKITRLTRYLNNYNRQRTKPRHLESSVITHRKMHSNTIRELSYSPKQKYLNEKTRKERIPWKIQKKGIDDKLTSETIYNKYIHKINKNNPLKPNGNRKIRNNFKMKRNKNYIKNNSIHNRTLRSIKLDNKLLNQTTIENKESVKQLENKLNKNLLNKTNIQYKSKEAKENKNPKKVQSNTNTISNNNIKDKDKENQKRFNKHKAKCLSNENLPPQTHRLKINNNAQKGSYLNNNFSDNINTIKEKSYVNGNFSIVNSISVSSVSSKKEMLTVGNKMNIFDLSCLIIDEKSIPECSLNLINKLKKNGYNATFNKTNKIKCSKNGINFEIDILKINAVDEDKNDGKDIFCYKINNKKGGIGFNKVISKILFGA